MQLFDGDEFLVSLIRAHLVSYLWLLATHHCIKRGFGAWTWDGFRVCPNMVVNADK